MALEEEGEKIEEVDFFSLLPGVLAQVQQIGDIKRMDSWRKAFPETDFMEVDSYYHMDIDWDKKTPLERAAWTVLLKDETQSSMRLEVGLSGGKTKEPGLVALLENATYREADGNSFEILPAADVFWWHLVVGSLKALDLTGGLDESRLPKTAKKGLVGDYLYSIPMSGELRQRLGGWFEHIIKENYNEIKLERLKIRVRKEN